MKANAWNEIKENDESHPRIIRGKNLIWKSLPVRKSYPHPQEEDVRNCERMSSIKKLNKVPVIDFCFSQFTN
jgi:hypothetical protein